MTVHVTAGRACRGLLGALLLLAAAPPGLAQPVEQTPHSETSVTIPGSFAPLINRVKPAVVNISTTELENAADRQQLPQLPDFPPGSPFRDFFRDFGMPNAGRPNSGMPHPPVTALGSGFIIDPAGFIVTNNHVIHNGTRIQATLQDGTTLNAKVIGHDDLTDLALLKVEAGHALPSVQWGDSDRAEVGDWVISVGNPFGLGGSVTAGILSARGRDIHQGPYDDFLQIDAPINQGNSGGPTFNVQGQVIGINTAIFSPNGGGSVGIGFAIPSNIARPVIAELQSSGKVVRGWMGVAVQGILPQTEDALGVKTTSGALVSSVDPNGPAAHAGIRPGDIIVTFNNVQVARVHDLTWQVANTAPGATVPVAVIRDGQTVSQTVTLGQMHPPGGRSEAAVAADHAPRLGLQLESVASARRQGEDLPSHAHGVVVTGVAPGSPADQAGLQPGDIIEQINRSAVSTPGQVAEAVRDAHARGKKSVSLSLNRDGQEQFVPLTLPDGNEG